MTGTQGDLGGGFLGQAPGSGRQRAGQTGGRTGRHLSMDSYPISSVSFVLRFLPKGLGFAGQRTLQELPLE